jgi:hypothetical protein
MREDGERLGRERREAIDRRMADLSQYREVIAGYRAESDGDESSFVRSLSAYVAAASDDLRLPGNEDIAASLISFLREDGLLEQVFGAMGEASCAGSLVFFRHVPAIGDREAFASVACEALVERALHVASEGSDRAGREAAQELCRVCCRQVRGLPGYPEAIDGLMSFPVDEVGLPLLGFLVEAVGGPLDESLTTFFASVAVAALPPAIVVRARAAFARRCLRLQRLGRSTSSWRRRRATACV